MPVDTLLHSLTTHRIAFAAAQRLYAQRLAPDFNVFDFIAPDELRLSAILAWLLDPAGSHGQGALFLAEFLREIGLPWLDEDLALARVAVEAGTDVGRRIDVLVRLPGAVLAIENKPFAADQPRQVADYLTWLDAQAPLGRRRLLYLAGADGALPSEESIASADRQVRHEAGELQLMSYGQLLPWLARARGLSRADAVCAFLDALARYVEKRFLGVRDMTERQQLIETVCRTSDNRRSAIQLLAAAADIRTALVGEVAGQLRARLPAGFALARADASAARYTGWGISLPGVGGLQFTVEFEASDYNWLIYGVSLDGAGLAAPNTKARLDAAFRPGKASSKWPWYRGTGPGEQGLTVPTDWRTGEEPWLAAEGGGLADSIAAAAEAFQAVLAPGAAARGLEG